jgi:uncharacterized membrane protein
MSEMITNMNNDMTIEKPKHSRIFELDLIRSFCFFCMIVDHAAYDFAFLFPYLFSRKERIPFFDALSSFCQTYWNSTLREIAWYFIVSLFFLLVGICSVLSKSNFKRGLKITIFALVISLVTYIGAVITKDPENFDSFGVLHFIGCSLLIISLLEKFIHKPIVYFISGIVIIGVGIYFIVDLQKVVPMDYSSLPNIILGQMLGTLLSGDDSFGFFPFLGIIFIGYFLGLLLYTKKKSIFKKNPEQKALTFLGRYPLWVYLLHQPVIIIIFGIIYLLCGYHISL